MSALRLFKIGAAGVVFRGIRAALHHNNYDVRSIGVVRLGRSGITACRIMLDYKHSLLGLDPNTETYNVVKSAVHERSASKLLNLARNNGGIWIKVGQHLSSLEYLLPAEYVRTLSCLHSKAPESSFADICRVIKEDLNKDANYLFCEICDKPSGSASLAQVHKANLKDGRTVAVKVQILVNVVAKLFAEFKLLWLAEKMRKNLPIELEFRSEGLNAEKVGVMFHRLKFLKAPKILWEFSSDRVLTMEFCEGGHVNDTEYLVKYNISPYEVCKLLGKLYSEMVFVDGFVHADPHPGNVVVYIHPGKGLKIVLLDHGLYTTLSPAFRMQYANLWLSIMKADTAGIEFWSEKLGVGDLYVIFACMITARSWKSVSSGIYKSKSTVSETDEIKEYVGTYLPEISDVLDRLSRPLLLVLKTNDLRGIEFALKTQHSPYAFVNMFRACVRAVYRVERDKCRSEVCRVGVTIKERWLLLRTDVNEKNYSRTAGLSHYRVFGRGLLTAALPVKTYSVRGYFSAAALAKGKRLLTKDPLPVLKEKHSPSSAFISASNDLECSEGQKSSEMVYLALCEAMNFRYLNAHGTPVTIRLASHPARRKFVRYLIQFFCDDEEEKRINRCYQAADELHKNFFSNEMAAKAINDCSQRVSALTTYFQHMKLPHGTKEKFQKFIRFQTNKREKQIIYDIMHDEFR